MGAEFALCFRSPVLLWPKGHRSPTQIISVFFFPSLNVEGPGPESDESFTRECHALWCPFPGRHYGSASGFNRRNDVLCQLLVRSSLEVKLPTIWTDEKHRWEESAKRREEERRSQKRKSQKKEDPGARKGRKVAKHCVFPMICGSGGSKSRLAKCRARWADEWLEKNARRCGAKISKSKCTKHTPGPDHFSKLRCRKSARHCGAKAKNTARSEHFLKLRCRKSEGIVARSTSAPDRFWILRCRKSARRCGAKHISKWKS